jgi:hypothetical protein
MMSDLQLTDNDLTIEGGDLVLERRRYEDVVQAVLVTLQTHRGEYELDTSAGVPWRAQVLGKGRSVATIGLLIKTIVEGVDGVIRVEDVRATLDRATRGLSITFNALIESDSGAVLTQGVVTETPGAELAATLMPLGGLI